MTIPKETLTAWAERTALTLTDEEWQKHLRAAELRAKHPGMVPTREDAALLAELDRIAGELTAAQHEQLGELARGSLALAGGEVRRRRLPPLRTLGLARRERAAWSITPLGRAVLAMLARTEGRR